ncbi:hypothetical protein [Rhodococcus sp. NPDC049939]|uniref:hypothetical protein n=1 Tax=Rhodococcus sp. NPDC049939 TaxID=3155511 RepID=UPI0033D33B11
MSYADEHDIERLLRAVPARSELAKKLKLRAVSEAIKAGWTQRQIAERVGVEQPEISRLAKAARLTPEVCERGPREVLLEYAAGLIDHTAMMDELEHWDYTFGRLDPTGETYLRGTWDQIEHAGDLISDADYERLFELTASRRVASFTQMFQHE